MGIRASSSSSSSLVFYSAPVTKLKLEHRRIQHFQFNKILQLTKSSGKKMSLEVAFETIESRPIGVCRSSSGSEFHAAGPAWEKASSPNFVRVRGLT